METKDNPVLKFIVKTEKNITVLILQLLFLARIVIVKDVNFDCHNNNVLI